MENNPRNCALVSPELNEIQGGFFSRPRRPGGRRSNRPAGSSWAVFTQEIFRSPRRAGAICPSGAALSNAMAREAVLSADGLVVELGAGTGAVTAALLNRGLAPERLVAVEQSATLAAFLRARFPRVNVIQGDAGRLSEWLPAGAVDSVVSSLPLVSLPAAVREAVIDQIRRLAAGRRLIQFTYFWGNSYLTESGFKLVRSQMVFKNFPPARVMTFEI